MQKFINKASTPKRDWNGIPQKENTPSGVCFAGVKGVLLSIYEMGGTLVGWDSNFSLSYHDGPISVLGYVFSWTSRKAHKVESENHNVSDSVIMSGALEDTGL